MKDSGSITPLLATYLASMLLCILGFSSVATAMLAGHRIQGVADYAILYGHDRSVRAGKPQEDQLRIQVRNFLASAESARRLELIDSRVWTKDEVSHIELCARYRNPFGIGADSMVVCRRAAAKSFLIL